MALTREDIIERIRHMAAQRGGDVGINAFMRETGINNHVIGLHGTWNELKQAAGLPTRGFMRAAIPIDHVLEAFARIVAEDGAWPTENRLRREKLRDGSTPNLHIFRRLRADPNFLTKLVAHCEGRSDFATVAEIALAREARQSQAETLLDSTGKMGEGAVRGHVYMMRSGRRVKIGRTNSPTRRHREVRLELPEPTTLLHTIETDDPPGIEAYWHKRFAEKRVVGTEFFELDAQDIAAFKRRKYQ